MLLEYLFHYKMKYVKQIWVLVANFMTKLKTLSFCKLLNGLTLVYVGWFNGLRLLSDRLFQSGSKRSLMHMGCICTAELTRALQETEHLLGEVSVMTRKQAPDVEQCASVLSSMEGVVEDEVSSLAR